MQPTLSPSSRPDAQTLIPDTKALTWSERLRIPLQPPYLILRLPSPNLGPTPLFRGVPK
jgi:hypothetical protein